jgi:hypothetical protein
VTTAKVDKAKYDSEKTELARRASGLESSLSASQEKGEEVACALGLEKSLIESEVRSADFTQQLNDNNGSTSRKVAQLSSEILRLKDEAAQHESTAVILTSEVSVLKIQMGTLRSDYQEALNQLASNAKPAESCLVVDSCQLCGFKGCPSIVTETRIETLEPAKSRVSELSLAVSSSEDDSRRPWFTRAGSEQPQPHIYEHFLYDHDRR